MKRLFFSLVSCASLIAISAIPAMAAPPNITGTWTVEQTGRNGTSTSKITLQQSGGGVVGRNATNGNGFNGTFVSDSKINGTWNGPGGAGWLTVYVTPNGHSFNGTWGYNGREANGSFVGNKILPPSPITAAGRWHVTIAGGGGPFTGPMSCTQSGPSTVCKINNVVINGRFRTRNKIRATWKYGSQAGWFSFWFNDDNNSFNGVWGRGAETSTPAGRVIGQRAL